MSETNYNLYLQKIFTFVKTITIKDTVSADTINQELITQGYKVLSDQPRTWKYYMNLAGLYHESDTKMQITSLDTLETVEFNPTILAAHRATKRAYRYGTAYYNILLSKYPEQEELILGCLNPIDLDTAIAADDHAIIYYDTTLVESQEDNFIPELQNWINAFFKRWDVGDYGLTDNLYQAALFAQLSQQMIPAILNIRLANCKTRSAHSYHIKEYLASHGGLDIYYGALTTEQALWLYRNIEYIRKHAGKKSTFDWLVENILDKRQIPLYEYSFRHNLTGQPESLTPVVELERKQINLSNAGLVKTIKDLDDTLKLEFPEARDNRTSYDEDIVAIEKGGRNARSNQLRTKILESEIIDRTNAAPFDFPTLLLNQWIYYVSKNILHASTIVTNPNTGQDMVLSAKEALTVWIYVICRLNGFTPTVMSSIYAIHVRKINPPTKAQIRAQVPSKRLSDMVLDKIIANRTVTPTTIISSETFYEHCSSLYNDLLVHRTLVDTREHYLSRGLADIAAESNYQDCVCNVNVGINFDDWLSEQGFEIKNLTAVEYEELSTSIVAAATGLEGHKEITIKEIQTAMLAIMEQLSSYGVQYIQTINDSGFKIIGPAAVRLGDIGIKGEAHHLDNLPTARVLKTARFSRTYYNPDVVDGHDLDFTYHAKGYASGRIESDIQFKQTSQSSLNFRIPNPRVAIRGFKVSDPTDKRITTITSATVTLIETDSAQTVSGYLPISKADDTVSFVSFVAKAGSKKYGNFTLDETGRWIYYMDGAHNEFVAGQTYTEYVEVESTDGALGTITVNINGTEDISYFTSAAVMINETNTILTAYGNISLIDPDTTTFFVDFANAEGVNKYGYFTLSKGGSWSYTAKSVYNELSGNASITDYINITTTDGVVGTITATIKGTDDLTIISNAVAALDNDSNQLTASGQIEMSDLDSAPSLVPLVSVPGQAGYGVFNLASNGAWTWTSTDLSKLTATGIYTDSILISSVDGATATITVNINNIVTDLPVINVFFNEDGS